MGEQTFVNIRKTPAFLVIVFFVVSLTVTTAISASSVDTITKNCESYNKGYSDGYNKGFTDGMKDALNGEGPKRFPMNYIEPCSVKHYAGYKEGYANGYQTGFENGYNRYAKTE